MKTTLNLGSFNFNINTASDRITNGSVDIELKDVSVTFEASIEETLEDIKMSLECFKELKSLASEFGNIFAGMEAKRQEQNHELEVAREKRYDEMDSKKSEFDRKFKSMSDRIDDESAEIKKSVAKDSRKSEFERKFQAMSNRIDDESAEIKKSVAEFASRIECLKAITEVKGN